MSIFKNTVSITRFDVSGAPTSDNGSGLIETLITGFKKDQFEDSYANEEIVFGWTSATDSFAPNFNDGKFIIGNYVHVGLRIDKKTVPSSVLKKEVYLACKARCEELGVDKLQKSQIAEIKERKMDVLLSGAYAVPNCFDIIWDVENKNLMMLSTNSIAIEILENLMFQSFGVRTRVVIPFTLALKNVDKSILSETKPTIFA